MQHKTKLKLAAVHQICNVTDKSTEFMLQIMQDICKVDLDICVKYLELPEEEHNVLFQEVNAVAETICVIDNNF
jgi:hypothetical protein